MGEEALGAGYVLEELIGRGATGQVWRGHARDDGRVLAFKLLRSELLDDPSLVARFLQERAILTKIGEHPNLVHIHDLVAEGSRFGIVMDLVPGRDLRKELLERRTLPAAEALTVVAQVLAGVAALHSAGVVHRDLKPENVLLAHYGTSVTPKVTDYGTARLVAEAATTRTTSVIGTALYMAPELADVGEVSAAADVYSAGIMLYELLCGVTPFQGGTPVAVLRRHIEQEPGRPDHVDHHVWQLLSRMLAKQPADRPLAVRAADDCAKLAARLVDSPALPPLSVPPTPDVETIRTKPVRPVTEKATVGVGSLRGRTLWLAGGFLAAVVAAGVVAVSVANAGTDRPDPTPTAAGPSTSTTAPPETPSESQSDTSTTSITSTSTAPTPTATVVPQLTGMSSDDAVAQLGALSVTPAITYVPDDSVADGTVISQSPAPGRPLTGPVTLKVARTATTVYLSDEQPVEGEPSTDAQEIDNRQYLHSVALGDAEGAWQGTQVLEYHLGGRFTKLTGRLGLSSASHSDAVVNYRLTTIPSHGEKSGQLKVGQSTGVNLNVTGAVRIRLVVTPSPDEWSYSAPVFGDAKLLGFPNDLPTDTATSDE